MDKSRRKFRFNSCAKSATLIEKILSFKYPTLKSIHPKKNLRTCAMLLNMEEHFIFDNKKIDQIFNIYPYYQGSKGLKEKLSHVTRGASVSASRLGC